MHDDDPRCPWFNSTFKIRSIRVRIYEDLIHCDHGAPGFGCLYHLSPGAAAWFGTAVTPSSAVEYIRAPVTRTLHSCNLSADRLERHIHTRTQDAEA